MELVLNWHGSHTIKGHYDKLVNNWLATIKEYCFMKLVDGWWVPDNDFYLQYYNGESVLSIEDWITEALTYVTDTAIALVAGARVGHMIGPLSDLFTTVEAYEAVPDLKEALDQNVIDKGWVNVNTHSELLVNLVFSNGSINWDVVDAAMGATERQYITALGSVPITTATVNSLGLGDIGFLYIDTWGGENFTLQSASNYIESAPYPVVYLKYYKERSTARYTVINGAASIIYLYENNFVERFDVDGNRFNNGYDRIYSQ